MTERDVLTILLWLQTNSSFITMAFVGACVAYIKAYEAKDERQTTGWHLYTFGVKLCYAAFISMVVFHAHTAWNGNLQLSFILTGLLSIFAEDAVTLMWLAVRRNFMINTGVNRKGGRDGR